MSNKVDNFENSGYDSVDAYVTDIHEQYAHILEADDAHHDRMVMQARIDADYAAEEIAFLQARIAVAGAIYNKFADGLDAFQRLATDEGGN